MGTGRREKKCGENKIKRKLKETAIYLTFFNFLFFELFNLLDLMKELIAASSFLVSDLSPPTNSRSGMSIFGIGRLVFTPRNY
jgi:hypothetical protein